MYQPVSSNECTQVHSSECPCILANIGQCLVCSHLQGEEICNCQWTKTCVYLNYKFDRKEFSPSNNTNDASQLAKVIAVTKDCYILYLLVSKHIFNQVQPLTKVNLYSSQQVKHYRASGITLQTFPEQSILAIGVQLKDCFDKAIILNSTQLTIQQFYEPVILGLKSVVESNDIQKVLITADLFAQLLLEPLIINILQAQKHKLFIYTHKLSPWIEQRLRNHSLSLYLLQKYKLEQVLKEVNPDYFISLGSDLDHKKAAQLLVKLKLNIPLAISLSE